MWSLSRLIDGNLKEVPVGVAQVDRLDRAEGARAGDQRPLGAAWLRHLTGEEQSYPAVDPSYPELAIAVLPGCTGRGIGGLLLDHLIVLARGSYPGIVLSVRANNPARRLYKRHGFVVTGEIINRVGTRSYVMERPLLP